MYKYKNESDQDLDLIGIGQVKAGQEFSSPRLIENPNIKILEGAEPTAPAEPVTNTENEETE